jgi:hypothetical protein
MVYIPFCGRRAPPPPIEVVRIPGYKYEYDEELDETKKIIEFVVHYGYPSWFYGQRSTMYYSIEAEPGTAETAEEFAACLKHTPFAPANR